MTIAGFHTSAELKDLVSAYDYQQNQLATAWSRANLDGSWARSDPSGWSQFSSDYKAWVASYMPVREHADGYLDVSEWNVAGLPAVDHAYTSLADAFAPAEDLDRRMRAGPASVDAPTYPDNPQPTAPDGDLTVLTWAQKVTAPIIDPLVGDHSLDPAKQQLPSWAKWGIFGAGAVGAMWVITKVKGVFQ